MTDLTVISLWQPWASLIFATGQPKRHETRHWRFPNRLRGSRIGIHAAKKLERLDAEDDLSLICDRCFGSDWPKSLPRGVLLGTVVLVENRPAGRVHLTPDDRECGNFAEGRWAWALRDPQLFVTPEPMIGRQGFWTVART